MMQSLPTSDVQDPPIQVFNPFVALQTLLSADAVSLKQRAKAAEQLEEYFRSLSPTPGLLLSYEPYLLLLTEIMVTPPVNSCQEVQNRVLSMLQALSKHNPSGFGDWIAMNTNVGNESWLMQWSYVLLLQTEKLVPIKSDGKWNELSTAIKEFDRVLARVLHMWRTLLDYTADAALVDQVVKYLQALLVQQTNADQWQTLLLKKLQPHFVDIADVLVGWMMSVEPNSLLREEILSLLHRFGRLWTDNSVFSLQLLNSFADEIVNLCDSWSDHQEGDDDRLSILVVSFTMVASCVPDLALNDGDVESPFVKVLHRVVSCTQPDYSLFCLANCSEYLIALSDLKRSQFPPLSVAAARFLLYHCAVQSQMHDSELDKLSKVVKNACQLASMNFHKIKDPCLVETIAIGALQDEILSKTVLKGGQPKRLKVMKCLFQLRIVSGIAYVTQLCLQLVWIGGIRALKVLGEQSVEHLSNQCSEEGPGYSVFAATCFILASRNTKRLRFTCDDDKMLMIVIFDLVTSQLEKESQRFLQNGSTPRQVCLVLKMACTFTGAISHCLVEQGNAVNDVNGICLRLLECTASLVPCEDVGSQNRRLAIHVLKMIEALLSEPKLVPSVPHGVFQRLIKAMNIVLHCSSVKVREESLPVFKLLTSRAEARFFFAVGLLETSMDLLLDFSQSVRDQVTSFRLSDIARWALVNNDKVHGFRHVSSKLYPSFVAADFEEIICLFQTNECSVTEWNRVCRRIVDRAPFECVSGNADVLLHAVRQAAEWCVQNRLRTHFGGPSQSFECIEGLLQEYSDRVQNMAGWTLKGKDVRGLSNWLMLEFVTALEMRIARAIHSTEVAQSSPESEQYKSALFFRTNKVVCDEWLTRIRPFLVKMSKDGSSYELCRYHSHAMMVVCYSKLGRVISSLTSRNVSKLMYEEFQQAEKDLDAALFSLCRCHIDAKDADSIIGFQKWSHSISSTLRSLYQQHVGGNDTEEERFELPRFRWLDAMRFEAEMRYEDAAAQYELLLQPMLAQVQSCSSNDQWLSVSRIFESPMRYLGMSPSALLGCFEQCANCFASLHEWTKLHEFAIQFIDIAQSLVDYDHHIEGLEEIVECSERWRDELGTICKLAPEVNELTEKLVNNEWEHKMHSNKNVARRLQEWGENRALDAEKVPDMHHDNVVEEIQRGLISLALQPSPWNGYAGEKIGKRAEVCLFRSSGISEKSHATIMHQTEVLTRAIRLNSEMHDSAAWSQLFCTTTPTLSLTRPTKSVDSVSLHLVSVARLTRKQRNFAFAQQLLRKAEAHEGHASESVLVAAKYEKAKLLVAMGMEDEGLHLLETLCESSLKSIAINGTSGLERTTCQLLLHLARKFVRADSTVVRSPAATSRFLNTTLISMTDLANQELWSDIATQDIQLTEPQDAAAHKCLVAAIAVSPQSAKAWLHYGHWGYDQGTQLIARIAAQGGYFLLESTDEEQLNAILDEISLPKSDRELLVRSFCQFLKSGERTRQQFDFFRHVCTEQASQNHTNDALNRLIQLQRACQSKLFRFYFMAARGYEKYLKALFSDSECNVPKQEVTLVTLRLLSLLTTYGAERDVASALQDVFLNGPVTPWSCIVPQLIARVHHPVTAVSTLVRVILKRLAHHSPHAIVYPIVMNSLESQLQVPPSLKERDVVDNTFNVVLHELQNVSPGLVNGVRLLVSELCRISVLWDEAWCSLLMKLAADVSRRITTLEKEAARLGKNATLSAINKSELAQRKVVAIMKPILVSIEKLWKKTCGTACDQEHIMMSVHERKFLKDYGGLIERAMKSFRDYCSSDVRAWNRKTPQELWHPFAEVLKALVKTTGRRDRLPLHEISPAMASTCRELSLANMPGVSCRHESPITITRIVPSVAVLKTKTKPKCLEFLGSDGKTRKYLLKAREDLRLDERIMQFLQVTNAFLRANEAAAARDLSAQYYSVIPLSRNAGLIQMVPDAVPLFQVYASRNEHQTNEQISPDNVGTAVAQQTASPTAQFYAKLKQHGITNVSPNNRAEWPLAVLKQVHQELVAQRPRNVLLEEILRGSHDLRESWTKSRRLSTSLAVMSVVGYLIGLGDRHLDNMLLCLKSGDIVHIDYNVCFDKGRRLKVPEVVPFRLTPLLQDALGFTGVEGKFRVALELTLRVVRSKAVRETLLLLLEVFVYSPLVDWVDEDKRHGRSGELKDRLDVGVNLSLFLSRAEERRQDTVCFGRQYEQFAEVITRLVNEMNVSFGTLFGHYKRLHSLEKEEHALQEEISTVETELAACKTAQSVRYEELDVAIAHMKEIRAEIKSFAKECYTKHQELDIWRQKSTTLATGEELHAVTRRCALSSFEAANATLCEILARSQCDEQQRTALTELESKCRSLDTDLKRLCLRLEELATTLVPYLSSYRKELEPYIASEAKTSAKDVYLMWWDRCTHYLDGVGGGNNEEIGIVSVTNPTATPSQENVRSHSRLILDLVDNDDLLFTSFHGQLDEDPSLLLKANQLLHDLCHTFSAMKVSNGQGQRLLRLAGASWILDAIGKLELFSITNTCVSSSTLASLVDFTHLVGVCYTCFTLLELASTPEGSMKKLQAKELLGNLGTKDLTDSHQETGESLHQFIAILQAVESFAILLQDDFMLNHYGKQQWNELLCQDLVKSIKGTSFTIQESMDATTIPPRANDKTSLVHEMVAKYPALHRIFEAALMVTQTISASINSLLQRSLVIDEEAKRVEKSSSAKWLDLVLDLVAFKQGIGDEVRARWLDHLNDFYSTCLVKLLRYLLSSIITFEWKLDFFALSHKLDNKEEQEGLKSQWYAFFKTQISDLLPATSLDEMLPQDVRAVNDATVGLMSVCEEWWGQQWRIKETASCRQEEINLQMWHQSTRQAVESEAIEVPQPPNLGRDQLVAFLSAQLPTLNALVADNRALEVEVVATTQQMDHLASTLTGADSIQSCFSNAMALFEYIRTLADLVEGILKRQRSCGEGPTEVEVSCVGKTIFEKALEVSVKLQSCSQAVSELDARVHTLHDELGQKKDMYNAVASRKRTAEAAFRNLCDENKTRVVETSRRLSKHVGEMRKLLTRFEKTWPKQGMASESDSVCTQQQLQKEKTNAVPTKSSSLVSKSEFSLMENDRLVKLLLRSIRSVNHLQMLEGVLERHGQAYADLRATFARIEQALTAFHGLTEKLQEEKVDPSAHEGIALLYDLSVALTNDSQSMSKDCASADVVDDDTLPLSLLMEGRDLVRKCVKLFFEATEMVDRCSKSAEDAGGNFNEGLPGNDEEEEQEHRFRKDAVAMDSKSKGLSVDESRDKWGEKTCTHIVEDKSQYGLQVLKRIENKLAGIVTETAQDAAAQLTVEQQATWLIDEALKTDNLCVMYEGWTPWI